MPEIVEIRQDAEFLDFFITYRELRSVKFITDLFNKHCKGIEDLNKCLPLKIERVLSKAKKIFIKLSNNWWIFITYGMTGRISNTQRKHSHIQFDLSHSWIGFDTWYYENARRIGYVIASNDNKVITAQINDMSEPFVFGHDDVEGFESITKKDFIDRIKSCKTYLAKALMDQRSIGSGIGQYLLVEIFYDANLHYEIKCKEMSDVQINNLWESINKIINKSYEYGGNSISDYFHIDGTRGEFKDQLQVYRQKFTKKGEPVYSKSFNGRTFYYIQNESIK